MIIIRPASLVSASPDISGLKRTSDLIPGLFIYGGGIPVETKILSITSATALKMDKNATATGAWSLEFTPASVGIWQERTDALIDIKNNVDERGDLIQFIFRTEANVARDVYNSIEKREETTSYFMRAYPVEFSPSIKKLEKAGLREECNVLIYTAMKDWINNGIDFKDIEIATRNTIKLQGDTYEIKEKALVSQFADTFLYITFALNKK